MKKKEEILKEEINEKHCNCKNGDKCTCGDNCHCGDDCKCGGNCQCRNNKNHYLKVFVLSFIGLLLFLGGVIIGAVVLYKNDEVISEKCVDDNKEKDNDNSEKENNEIVDVEKENNEIVDSENENNEIVDSENDDDKTDISNSECNNVDTIEKWTYVSDYDRISQRVEDLSLFDELNRQINSVSDLKNQELLLFAVNILGFDESYTLDEINEVILSYFGKKIVPENIKNMNSDIIYNYDKNKKVFNINYDNAGGGLFLETLNKIVDVQISDDIYTVEIKKVFSYGQDIGPGSLAFYRTIKDAENRKNPVFGWKYDEYDSDDEYMYMVDFLNYPNDKMNSYYYVFKKVEDEFVLMSINF